jgi:hypothetical protein
MIQQGDCDRSGRKILFNDEIEFHARTRWLARVFCGYAAIPMTVLSQSPNDCFGRISLET